MFRVSVLYATGDSGVRDGAGRIAEAVQASRFAVRCQAVADSTVADLSSSDLIVFVTSGAELGSEFDDLARAFSGINLAGRMVAIAHLDGAAAAARLRGLLDDTDALLGETAALAKSLDGWIDRTVQAFDDLMRSRGRL